MTGYSRKKKVFNFLNVSRKCKNKKIKKEDTQSLTFKNLKITNIIFGKKRKKNGKRMQNDIQM